MALDAPANPVVEFTLDGRAAAAAPGQLLIDACEQAGTYIPRFCYHPRMRSVGMCRMCLVEVDTGRGPALQPACMLSVSAGMVVETASPPVVKAQDGVLEFLLLNHPLDCPVCDKGGECPLQDQTMAFGPGESRFVEEKRHFAKPIPISDLVFLDRERCILCDRCTRFADEVAGEALIGFQSRGSHTQVNTFPDQPFDSYFSGNTVQICPVGALTARPYRFKARPWDLSETVSTYPNAVGDRISVHASRNRILRIQGVDSDAVNWGWLSDRDRFSFEAVHSPERLTQPMGRSTDGELAPLSTSAALGATADALRAALHDHGPQSVALLGGAGLCAEDQYAWAKLAKGVLATDNVDARMGDGLAGETICALPRATIADACRPGGVVLLLSGDLREEFGTLYLRLRRSLMDGDVALLELTPLETSLSSLADCSLRVRPGDAARVVEALLETPRGEEFAGIETKELAAAASLLSERPLTVLLGRTSQAESAAATERAAILLARAFPQAKFLPLLRRGSAVGALEMGLAPRLLPGRTTLAAAGDWYRRFWGAAPAEPGLDAAGILRAAVGGKIKVLILLGADPATDFPDRRLVEAALASVPTIVALDAFPTASSRRAHVLLPTATFGEREGTHVNVEGRATAVTRQVTSPAGVRVDWQVAAELADLLGADLGLSSPRQIWEEVARLSPLHAGLTWDGVRANLDGVLMPTAAVDAAPPAAAAAGEESDAASPEESDAAADEAAADAPLPPSLRLADLELPEPPATPFDGYSFRLVADRTLYDKGTIVSHCPSLAAKAAPARLRLNPSDFERLAVGKDALVSVTSSSGDLTVSAAPDGRVPPAVAALALNTGGADPRDLISSEEPICEVRIVSSEL